MNGGSGTDTLTGPDVDSSWKITATGGGTLTGAPGKSITFSAMENLIGGSAADTFVFNKAQKIAGKINGGSGLNTLNYSAYTTAVSVSLATGKATGTSGISHISDVLGGSASDTLTGDTNNNFLSGNGGNDTISGGGGDILMGGAGNDKITGSSGRDLIFGGAGVDTLSGSGDDDILFDGTTTFDANRATIDALFTFWNAPICSMATESAH